MEDGKSGEPVNGKAFRVNLGGGRFVKLCSCNKAILSYRPTPRSYFCAFSRIKL